MRMHHTVSRHHLVLLAAVFAGTLLVGCSDDDSGPTAPGGEDPVDWFGMTASQDTYLDEDRASTNYGQSGILRVSPDHHALLQFDLTALPEDAVISDLRLRLTQTAQDEPATAASVRLIWMSDDGWDEDEATDDDAPGLGSESLGDFPLDALAAGLQPVTFLATAIRQKAGFEQFYGNRVLGIRLESNQSVSFLSGEYPDTQARPTLEVTYAEGTRVLLTASDGASISPSNPDTNYDELDELRIDRNVWHTLLKFGLADLPADATIAMARLRMLANDGYAWGGDGNVYSYEAAGDMWSSSTVTAASAPEVVGDHLGYWWLWYDGTDRDAWGVTNSSLMRTVVAAELAGDRTLSLRLRSPGYATDYYHVTDEDPSRRPSLEIVYTR